MNAKRSFWVKLVKWAARIGSLGSIVILLSFFIGEGFNPAQMNLSEWIGLLLFPIGIVVGMIIAWRNELPGGLVTVCCLIAFYIYNWMLGGEFPAGWAFLLFSLPGFLFLVCGLIGSPGAGLQISGRSA